MSTAREQQDSQQVLRSKPSHILATDAASHVSIPRDVFERMFQSKVDFANRKPSVFGGPTAIAVAGFLLCTTPLSMQLLGWHGADQLGYATV